MKWTKNGNKNNSRRRWSDSIWIPLLQSYDLFQGRKVTFGFGRNRARIPFKLYKHVCQLDSHSNRPRKKLTNPKACFGTGKNEWCINTPACIFHGLKKNQIYYGGALVLINTAHKELIHVHAGVLLTCLWCKQYLYFIQKLLESNFLLLGFSFQILKNNWDEVIMLNVFIEFW